VEFGKFTDVLLTLMGLFFGELGQDAGAVSWIGHRGIPSYWVVG